jgi:hypothetical protein
MCGCDDAVQEDKLRLCCALCCINCSVYEGCCRCIGCSGKVRMSMPLEAASFKEVVVRSGGSFLFPRQLRVFKLNILISWESLIRIPSIHYRKFIYLTISILFVPCDCRHCTYLARRHCCSRRLEFVASTVNAAAR